MVRSPSGVSSVWVELDGVEIASYTPSEDCPGSVDFSFIDLAVTAGSTLELIAEDCAGNLVVLKTAPGLAGPTAIELDRSDHPDLVGTVAGDDTVFVATRSSRAARSFARLLAPGAES